MSTIVLLITHDRDLMKRLLSSYSCFAKDALTILCVDRLSDATQRLSLNASIHAVILDWDPPAARGFDALLVLMGAAADLPIIVLGDDPSLPQQMNLVEHGAQDYLLKRRADADTVICMVHSAIARKSRERILFYDKARADARLNSICDSLSKSDDRGRITFLNPIAETLIGGANAEAAWHLMRRDWHQSMIEDPAAPIHDPGGHIGGIAADFHKIIDSPVRAQRMTYLAEHDIPASLPNWALLADRIEQGVAMAERHGRRLAVLSIDLDHFKHINDSLGRLIGDQLLRAVALRIALCVRSSDTVSHEGGDEFIVLLSEISHAEDAALIADKIRQAILKPYTIANHQLHLTTSIGVSLYPEDGADPETLIQCADTATYHAKEKGRNKSQFFKEEMNFHAAEREIITGDLRHALKRGEFMLDYQPKVNLTSGAITGVEALIRWQHPRRGVLLPLHFMQTAEDCGLIVQIGQWALQAACVQAQAWLASGFKLETMAVNISAVEFHNDRFFDGVCRVLKTTGLEPRYLELELTETAVMRNLEETTVVLQSLSAMGIRITVDDFGTGYSNLSYLKRFPISTLKLDKSLVHDVPESQTMATIVGSVIHMGQSLRLQVVAEGVENAQQLKFLQTHDCTEGQGFYFSKPVNSDQCRSLISQGEQHWARHFSSPTSCAIK
jgi:diguanylate cyclase (GGDEF)-like protein